MKGKIERLQGDSWSAGVFAPENPAAQPLPLIVMNLSDPADLEPLLPELKRKMGKEMRPAYLAALDGSDWNRDYSPWPAPPLRPGEAPFPGGAPQRLRLLTEQVLPSLRAHYPICETPEDTGIFGYSLGGLAALYMAYESPEFGLVGCLSGSLWYEGFMPWAESRRLASPGARVYLSLGRKEEKTRNPYLCKIGDCYRREEELLTRQLGEENVTMTWHDGGHATEVPRRMLLGLETLLKTPAL